MKHLAAILLGLALSACVTRTEYRTETGWTSHKWTYLTPNTFIDWHRGKIVTHEPCK